MLDIFQDFGIYVVVADAEFEEAIAANAWVSECLPGPIALRRVSRSLLSQSSR